MADPRFFERAGPFSVGQLAQSCDCVVGDNTDPSLMIDDVGPLESAGVGQLSFLDNRKYLKFLPTTLATVVVLHPDFKDKAAPTTGLLLSKNPYRSYGLAAQLFYPKPCSTGEISNQASIHETAKIGQNVEIGAFAVIEAGVEIGDGTVIGALSFIGRHVKIGSDCRINTQVSISHALIGDRVTLYPGVKIGQDGFGFAPDPRGHVKIPQLGRVIIGNDVEIGANSTIDRGAGPDTEIGDHCWIDNLVMLGHNVKLGRGCIVVAQSGVSGSTQLEDFVVLAAQTGLAGHLVIGKGARVAARGGVMDNIPAGETWGGTPAVPFREWMKQSAMLRRYGRGKGKKHDE